MTGPAKINWSPATTLVIVCPSEVARPEIGSATRRGRRRRSHRLLIRDRGPIPWHGRPPSPLDHLASNIPPSKDLNRHFPNSRIARAIVGGFGRPDNQRVPAPRDRQSSAFSPHGIRRGGCLLRRQPK